MGVAGVIPELCIYRHHRIVAITATIPSNGDDGWRRSEEFREFWGHLVR